MPDIKEKRIEPIIAGVLLSINSLYGLYNFVMYLKYSGAGFFRSMVFLTPLLIISNIFLAVLMFMQRKDKLLIIPSGLIALFTVLQNIGYIVSNIIQIIRHPYLEVILPNLLYIICDVVSVLAPVAFLLFVLSTLTDKVKKVKFVTKECFYIPAVLVSISVTLNYISSLVSSGYVYVGSTVRNIFTFVVSFAIMLFATAWVEDLILIKKREKKMNEVTIQNNNQQQSIPVNANTSILFIPLVKHILLTFFTFGIWQFIWIYKTTQNLNACVNGEKRSELKELLLCLFIPFYSIYWIYKTATLVDLYAQQQNKQSDIAKLCLILAIFIPVVPVILIQDKLNGIVTGTDVIASTFDAPQQQAPVQQVPVQQQEPVAPQVDAVEQIKRFKELLDMGAITEEEYNAKKKEFLGL